MPAKAPSFHGLWHVQNFNVTTDDDQKIATPFPVNAAKRGTDALRISKV
jgi:hypothetical protein